LFENREKEIIINKKNRPIPARLSIIILF